MAYEFQSPFLSAVAKPRQKGLGEQILDDLAGITAKQAVALPVTLPLQAGAGAIEGLSFGLLSPTDELEQFLGEYAPPKPLQTAAEIAGTIGGSFVPYIGASRVASGIFTGLGTASKLARGAFTFGAPEILRQALAQEIDPQHAGRALATGAAFSLPLPRPLLAPAVAATELMFGASPLEAGVSAGFAALFGPLGDETKKAVLPEAAPVPARGLARSIRGLLPGGSKFTPAPPKSQVDLILETVGKADLPEARVSLQQLAQNVKALSNESEDSLVNALVKASDTWGPEAPATKGLQYALAQKRKGFVPANALTTNPLRPPAKGIETITPGPTNPFEMRSMHEEMLANLRASGGKIGHTKAAQLEQLVYEARQEAAALKTRGQTMTPQRMAEIQARQDAIMSGAEVTFATEAEALSTASGELAKSTTPAAVDSFTASLPSHYQRDPAFAEQLRRMVTERKALLARQLKPRLALPEKTPEVLRLEESARPYGADISLEGGRVTLRHAGQPIRDFRTTADAETWLKALETGEAAPLDPTRLLASMRQQLMTEGTIRGWHGTSAERAEQVLAKGFHPLNRDTEVLKAIEDAGIGAQQWKTLPKSLRDNIRPSFAAISQERSKVHFTSDPAYAAEYSALGGEFYQEALVRTRMVKTALDHGYTPNEGDNMMQIIGYLNRNTLHVTTAEIKDPLRRSVVAADIKVSPAERQILLGQLDALLVAPPKDEQGTIDALSKLFTEIRVVPKDVKIRRMTQDPQNTLRTWENLPIEGGVNNVQELRMLAHSRAMVVDYDGAALNVTNQMTGETIRGLNSLKEAAEAIRSAPNVAVEAREIGPQVPGAPPLPGAGSLHGLSSEQPPPFCPLLSTE